MPTVLNVIYDKLQTKSTNKFGQPYKEKYRFYEFYVLYSKNNTNN